MSSEFGQFLDDLPDLNLPESKKPKRSAAYFINLRGISEDTYKYLVQLDAWLDTPEKLSQWRAIVDAVLQRVQRYEKRKHKQSAKHPWPFAREPQELNLRIDEDLEALCVIISLWHDHYTSGYPVLTAQQKETIRKWPYRPCSYGAAVLPQWFVHLDRYLQGKGFVSDLAKVALQQPTETSVGEKIVVLTEKQRNIETKTKQPITLKSFIKIHCDLTAKPDVQSKVTLLHEYNQKDKISLPKLAHKYRKGQHKYYYVEDLKKNWTTYQKKMPTLPPLKQPEN